MYLVVPFHLKARVGDDERTQTDIIIYEPVQDRIDFVCQLARQLGKIGTTQCGKSAVSLLSYKLP